MNIIEESPNILRIEKSQFKDAKIIISIFTIAGVIFFILGLYSGISLSESVILPIILLSLALSASFFSKKTIVVLDREKKVITIEKTFLFKKIEKEYSYQKIEKLILYFYDFSKVLGSPLNIWHLPIYFIQITTENGKKINLIKTSDRKKQEEAVAKIAKFLNVRSEERFDYRNYFFLFMFGIIFVTILSAIVFYFLN